MSDINPVMAAKTVFVGICLANGVEPEKAWVKDRLSKMKKKHLNKWSIERLRKHLLESFCEPGCVEVELTRINAKRALYENSR